MHKNPNYHEFQNQQGRELTEEDFLVYLPQAMRAGSLRTGSGYARRLKRDAARLGPSMEELLERLISATKRHSRFSYWSQTVLANTPVLALPAVVRDYLIIQNKDALNSLFIGLDFQPSSVLGFTMAAGGFYEPFQVPSNDVWLNASANVAVTIFYAYGN